MNAILWFRRDLRLTDNLALGAALANGHKIIPVFIFDDRILRSDRVGAPRVKFMLKALASLNQSLRDLGSQLIIRHGDPSSELERLIAETDAEALYFNRDYTPFARKRDRHIAESMPVIVYSYHDLVLRPPTTVCKADGDPYVVFTPFRNTWREHPPVYDPHRAPAASDFAAVNGLEAGQLPTLQDLDFEATIDVPDASEAAAQKQLEAFMDGAIQQYKTARNTLLPDPMHDDEMAGTSGLSFYLRWGILSPRQAWHVAENHLGWAKKTAKEDSIITWQNELIWRDFYHHILYFFPKVRYGNFRTDYDDLPWRNNPDDFAAWQDGMTGFPIVDAAMRQLKAIGWMHNRARMIVASFLCKDLLIDWRLGEQHFMQWLIDGDTAANNGGWQWAAGTGTDAQPYFRIFNPISQSEKYDPDGAYIRRWIPELRDVPDVYIHEPWKMDPAPPDYPAPMVDHREARERALETYKAAKSS